MITINKLKIYVGYSGDLDMWTRMSKSAQAEIISTKDWYQIDDLLQDIKIVKNGQSSPQFANRLNEKLLELCENEEAIRFLKAIVKNDK